MSTLVENVAKVKSAHDALSASIEAKGVSVPAGTKLTGMPALVDQIQTGGGGGVSEEYVDSKVQEEATARQNADEALRADIPTKTSELSNDSGYLTKDATTLSVAFGGLARKITPKDVISFSSLTWQGQKHELGSKDFGVFDGNFQLDEAFWPAKPLPGYLYIQIDGTATSNTTDRFYIEVYDAENHTISTFDVINNMVYKIPDNASLCQLKNMEIENYGNKNYVFTKLYYNVNTSVFDVYEVSRDQPSVGFDSKSTMAYSLLVRCSQPSMIFFNYGGTTNLTVDYNNTYQVNEMCFIPIYSNFMTSDSNIYARYIDSSHQYVKQEISPGNL